MSSEAGQVNETPQQRELLKMAVFRAQRARQFALPAIKQMGQDILRANETGSFERQRAAGAAQTDTAAAFGQAGEALRKNAVATGTQGSGRAALDMVKMAGDQATASGLGTVAADQSQDDKYVAGLQTMTALGQGQEAAANQGAATGAQLSGQTAAAAAQRSLSDSIGTAGLLAQGVGTGLGMWQSSANQPVYDYNYRGAELPNELRGGR